jgi:hypothetical protein
MAWGVADDAEREAATGQATSINIGNMVGFTIIGKPCRISPGERSAPLRSIETIIPAMFCSFTDRSGLS